MSAIGQGTFAEHTLASAATVDLGATDEWRILITGAVTITSFGAGVNKLRRLRFAGALILTHNAASLILEGGANITTAAGDTAWAESDGGGNWRVQFKPASGKSVTGPAAADVSGLATVATSGSASDLTGTLAVTHGGSGLGTATLGDLRYGSGANTIAALAGNTAATKKFLTQTGTGTVSAAPAWGPIAAADVPASALTKTDDTNVTLTLGGTPALALLAAASLTLGWTGTLAAPRLNSNVVQAVSNDTNVTGSISAQTLTLGWTGVLGSSRGGAGTISGALKGNGAGTVSQAAASDLSDTVAKTAWTPSDQSGASLSLTVNEAFYYRIGKLVFVYFDITYPATANASLAQVSLPVAPVSTSNIGMGGLLSLTNVSTVDRIQIHNGGTSAFYFSDRNENFVANSALTTGTLRGSLVYLAT